MKKILSVMLTLALSVMLFSSCGLTSAKSPTVGKFYSEHAEDTSWVYQNVTAVPDLPSKRLWNTIGHSYELGAFVEEGATSTKVFVYSLLQNKSVHTFTVSNDDVCMVEFIRVNGNPLFTVIHGVKRADSIDFSTTLYDMSGKQLARANGVHVYLTAALGDNFDYDFEINVEADLIRFDKTVFKVADDGAVTLLKEKNNFSLDLPDIRFYNKSVYIASAENGLAIYDSSLEPIFHHTYRYASDGRLDYGYFFLNDGTVLQSIETVPDDSISYDICKEGKKCKVSTLLIDPKKGTEKKVKLPFVLNHVYALDQNLSLVLGEDYDTHETIRESAGISKKYQNIASISYIENKKLTNPVTVALNNNGKIVCELFSDLPLNSGGIPMRLADDLFYYHTVNGTYAFINEKNEHIIEISASAFDELEYNTNYIVSDGVIYDHSFRPIYDFGANGYQLYSQGLGSSAMMSDGILLTRDGSTYLYRNGSVNLLAAKADNDDLFDELFSVSEHYYVIKTTEHRFNFTFTYFNAHGEKLFTSPHSGIRKMWSRDLGILLFKASDSDGNDILYYISK